MGNIDVASIWLQFHVLSALSPEGCLRACYAPNNNKETEQFVQRLSLLRETQIPAFLINKTDAECSIELKKICSI